MTTTAIDRLTVPLLLAGENFEMPLQLQLFETAHGPLQAVELDMKKCTDQKRKQKQWAALPRILEIYGALLADRHQQGFTLTPAQKGAAALTDLFGEIGALHEGKYRCVRMQKPTEITLDKHSRELMFKGDKVTMVEHFMNIEVNPPAAHAVNLDDFRQGVAVVIKKGSQDDGDLLDLLRKASFREFWKAWISMSEQGRSATRQQRADLIKKYLRNLSQNPRDPENAWVLSSIERGCILALGWAYEAVMATVLYAPPLMEKLSPLSLKYNCLAHSMQDVMLWSIVPVLHPCWALFMLSETFRDKVCDAALSAPSKDEKNQIFAAHFVKLLMLYSQLVDLESERSAARTKSKLPVGKAADLSVGKVAVDAELMYSSFSSAESEDSSAMLQEACQALLTPEEFKLISALNFDGLSVEVTAQRLGKTVNQVYALEQKILKKLAREFAAEGLEAADFRMHVAAKKAFPHSETSPADEMQALVEGSASQPRSGDDAPASTADPLADAEDESSP